MFYFSYDLGEFYLIREFNDYGDFEIADIMPFFDIKKIYNWCKCLNLKFPYEFNDRVYEILSKLELKTNDWDNIKNCLNLFHVHVVNRDIKIYCKESKK